MGIKSTSFIHFSHILKQEEIPIATKIILVVFWSTSRANFGAFPTRRRAGATRGRTWAAKGRVWVTIVLVSGFILCFCSILGFLKWRFYYP